MGVVLYLCFQCFLDLFWFLLASCPAKSADCKSPEFQLVWLSHLPGESCLACEYTIMVHFCPLYWITVYCAVYVISSPMLNLIICSRHALSFSDLWDIYNTNWDLHCYMHQTIKDCWTLFSHLNQYITWRNTSWMLVQIYKGSALLSWSIQVHWQRNK